MTTLDVAIAMAADRRATRPGVEIDDAWPSSRVEVVQTTGEPESEGDRSRARSGSVAGATGYAHRGSAGFNPKLLKATSISSML